MKLQHHKLAAWADSFALLFNSSPAQVALLDLDGVIVQTNQGWQKFGRENGLPRHYECIGVNYLLACETAATRNYPGARDAYVGLLEVIRLQRPKFTMVYPCHSPTERRWFRLWVQPQMPEVPGIIVAHYPCMSKTPIDASKPIEFGTTFLADSYGNS